VGTSNAILIKKDAFGPGALSVVLPYAWVVKDAVGSWGWDQHDSTSN